MTASFHTNPSALRFETLTDNQNYPGVMDIHPQEVHRVAARVKVIDVRQPEEYTGELGHIPQAELLPLDSLPEKLPELSRETSIIFICRSGGRSARAAAFARSLGFDAIYNMKGGMQLWNELLLPVERE